MVLLERVVMLSGKWLLSSLKISDLKFALTSNLAMVGLRGLRNGTISNSTRQGEGAFSDAALIESGREEIARLIAQYEPHFVYNMDKTVKRYNMRPVYRRSCSYCLISGLRKLLLLFPLLLLLLPQ